MGSTLERITFVHHCSSIAQTTLGARDDLLEVLDDRVGTRSTIITSQQPLEHWHARLQDPSLADAILDRLVHLAHKMSLKGESMRKTNAKQSSAS